MGLINSTTVILISSAMHAWRAYIPIIIFLTVKYQINLGKLKNCARVEHGSFLLPMTLTIFLVSLLELAWVI